MPAIAARATPYFPHIQVNTKEELHWVGGIYEILCSSGKDSYSPLLFTTDNGPTCSCWRKKPSVYRTAKTPINGVCRSLIPLCWYFIIRTGEVL
jgi:hypothetical protein